MKGPLNNCRKCKLLATMHKKIQRNDLCPCGSGRKFKNCCLGKSEDENNSIDYESMDGKEGLFINYIKDHDSGSLLNIVIGAQLLPENHGKEVRFELITKEIVRHLNSGKSVDKNAFIEVISQEWPSNHLEDPPEGLFAENMIFHGGNYTILPGIAPNGSNVFQYFIEAIFDQESAIPQDTKGYLYSGIRLVLELVHKMLERNGIKGNVRGNFQDSIIKFNGEIEPITTDFLHELLLRLRIDSKVVSEFVTQPEEILNSYGDPDQNILIYRPLILFHGLYYYTTPIDQLLTLNDFIKRIILKKGLEYELANSVIKRIWADVHKVCARMSWVRLSITLPALPKSLHICEDIYQFDFDHFVYVVLINAEELYYECQNSRNEDDYIKGIALTRMVAKRNNEVITLLKGISNNNRQKYLSLYLLNNYGQDMMLGMERSRMNEESITLPVYDFVDLGIAGEWNHLSLWKFAKAFHKLMDTAELIPGSQMIDFYGLYKKNECSFYLSDKKRPNLIYPVIGMGGALIADAKVERDYHGVLSQIGNKWRYISVEKYRDHAPIYKPTFPIAPYAILVGGVNFPFWIINEQCIDEMREKVIDSLIYGIAFWFTKLSSGINEIFSAIKEPCLWLNIELAEDFFKSLTLEDISVLSASKELSIALKDSELKVHVPIDFYKLIPSADNSGERHIMKQLLLSFNYFEKIHISDAYAEDLINKSIPLGPAKMIRSVSTSNDIRLDPRWLVPKLLLSDTEVNLLLDDIPSLLDNVTVIPEEYDNVEDKISLCNQVVLKLISRLFDRLSEFNDNILLNLLVNLNEVLIREREFNKLQVPAQIHCFGNFIEKVQEYEKEEINLLNSSLATRCLIEILAAKRFQGENQPSYDEIDELLAIMHEIVNFGILSDSMHYGLDNPRVRILESDRIGVSREFHNEVLFKYKEVKTYSDIENVVQNSFQKVNPKKVSNDKSPIEIEKIDKAFLMDWGISFTNFFQLVMGCIVIAEKKHNSVVEISENDLINRLKVDNRIPENEINNGLKILALTRNDTVISKDFGYLDKEYYPWRYGRKHSYLRRPLIKSEKGGTCYYTYGMRQIYDSYDYLNDTLFEGRLVGEGKQLDALRGAIEEVNGAHFRNMVKDWFKNNTSFFVSDFEVEISPKGHLASEENLGDIDVFLYDNVSTIYSIECKKTVQARIMHEMKSEMDKYLGQDLQSGKIKKHIKRDTWLKANTYAIQKFLNVDVNLNIKSLVITSEIIPLPYLRGSKLPLKFLSFPELKRIGPKIIE